MKPSHIKRIVRVALVIGSLGVVVALPRVAIDFHRRARIEHLSAKALEATHVLLEECRWERPVVGGPPREEDRRRTGGAKAIGRPRGVAKSDVIVPMSERRVARTHLSPFKARRRTQARRGRSPGSP